MAKPNYAFAKRQRDIAKKQKKEEKRLRKAAGKDPAMDDTQPQPAEAQTDSQAEGGKTLD
jgi:hypothetical protein